MPPIRIQIKKDAFVARGPVPHNPTTEVHYTH